MIQVIGFELSFVTTLGQQSELSRRIAVRVSIDVSHLVLVVERIWLIVRVSRVNELSGVHNSWIVHTNTLRRLKIYVTTPQNLYQ